MTGALRWIVRPDGRCLVRSRGGWTATTAAAAAERAERLGRPTVVHVDTAQKHFARLAPHGTGTTVELVYEPRPEREEAHVA